MKKFNSKVYCGKRIYRAISGNSGIYKMMVWNENNHAYQPPIRGNTYLAKKRTSADGRVKRLTKTFQTLAAAQSWMKDVSNQKDLHKIISIESGPKFRDVFKQWENSAFKNLRSGSQVFYMNRQRYLEYFFNMNMQEISSYTVDSWIEWLKSHKYQTTRSSFNNELNFLKVIFNYHVEHSEKYISPIKKRHSSACVIRDPTVKSKNLSEAEFNSFLAEIKKLTNGHIFAALATVQYYQALRISETAALSWADVQMNTTERKKSTLIIRKAVKWIRKKGFKAVIESNIKNSRTLINGYKHQPLVPQTYLILSNFKLNALQSDLIFSINGEPLEYRAIQNAYDSAFKNAGLSYRGTHILRHGGCRRSFNKHGDLSIAQQQLGNKSIASVLVYAVREETAYYNEVEKEWDSFESSP